MINKDSIQKLKDKIGLEPQCEFAIEHHEEYLDAWIGEDRTMHKDYLISGNDKIKLSFQHIGTSRDNDEQRQIELKVDGKDKAIIFLKEGTFAKSADEKPTCDFDKMADILLDMENCLKKGKMQGKYIDGCRFAVKDDYRTTSDYDNPKALEAVKEVMDKFIFNTPEHQEILTEKRQKQDEQTKLAVRLSKNKTNHLK